MLLGFVALHCFLKGFHRLVQVAGCMSESVLKGKENFVKG